MGGSYFFLNSFAGRQAGSLPCLALSSCDCMCDEPSHGEGGREGSRRSEANDLNVSFFFLGAEQDREENPSISSYIYTYCTHIHTRTRERDGEEGKNKKR